MHISWPVCCLLVLSACSSSDNGEQTAPLDAPSTSAAAIQNTSANGASEVAVFLQTFAAADYPTPDTTTTGSLAVRNGCVLFLVAGRPYRAILPHGSRYETSDAILLGDGRRIQTGHTITVKGGEGAYGNPADIPAKCPRDAVLIGDVQ